MLEKTEGVCKASLHFTKDEDGSEHEHSLTAACEHNRGASGESSLAWH